MASVDESRSLIEGLRSAFMDHGSLPRNFVLERLSSLFRPHTVLLIFVSFVPSALCFWINRTSRLSQSTKPLKDSKRLLS
jgi:hypothetical protein